MAYKKAQKTVWLFLSFLGISHGAMTLALYEFSVWSILAGALQLIGGLILLLIVYKVFEKKEKGGSM